MTARAFRRWLVRAAVGMAGYALVVFLAAGRVDWVWGWALVAVLAGVLLAHPLLLLRLNPEVLVERDKGLWPAGVKAWDRWITAAGGGLMLLIWVVAGLDVRFGWSGPVALPVHLVGLTGTALGHALFVWAMVRNPFFSQGVRIQTERGHTAVSAGPYRYVRHPGYAGTILAHLATPLLLGSWWALVPAALLGALFVARTWLEDRTLQRELDGYLSYAAATRSRLVPGVW